MTENRQQDDSLAEEFRQFGKNLSEAIQAAWDSPERKRFQQQIATELVELGTALKEEAGQVAESPAVQRVRSGEVATRIREEMLAALRTANAQLRRAVEGRTPTESSSEDAGTPKAWGETSSSSMEGRDEVHPDDVDTTPDDLGHREIHPDDVES